MNHLITFLERLQQAELAYKTAKTSLDNSLEYILCREELNQARFLFDKECRKYVMKHCFGETTVDECEGD